MLRRRMTGNELAGAKMHTIFNFSIFASSAMVAAALAIAPAVAENGDAAAEAHSNDPMTIVVTLRNQKAHVYRGMSLITSTSVSTGKRGYSTKAGVYSILEKRRRHYSNLYNGAPMPWMQRLTWTGTALHAGVVPGYPASHGCIRLPYSFAPKLFSMTSVGAQVVVANSMVRPKPISHRALFQPLPPPMPPELVSQDKAKAEPLRKSSLDPASGHSGSAKSGLRKAMRSSVIFAKAEAVTPRATPLGTSEPTVALVREITGSISPTYAAQGPSRAASLEDTNDHAIDPSAAPFAGRAAQGFPAEDSQSQGIVENTGTISGESHASVGTSDDVMKHEDRLKHQERLKHQARIAEPTDDPAQDAEAVADAEPQDYSDHHVRPILNVSATTLAAREHQPLSVSLSLLGVNDHPPVPLERPSVMMFRLTAGAATAAVQAADPISQEPLRILITRRTARDRTVDIQHMLSDMGYLAPQNFDGTRGTATVRALKAFQKANDMPVTGAFTDDVTKKIYEVAGKTEPPHGQLFVRQKFANVFAVSVHFANPDKPLGTHLFTVMHFAPGSTAANWTAISLNDKESANAVLDRIEVPEDVRQRISERLTPGSSLIVADTAINSAALPKGADFLVWDTSKAPKVQRASTTRKQRAKKRRVTSTRRRVSPAYTRQTYSRSRYSRRSSQRRNSFRF